MVEHIDVDMIYNEERVDGTYLLEILEDLIAKAINEFRAQHNHNDVAVLLNGVE